MNETLQKYWDMVKSYFGKFSPKKRILMGVLGGLIVLAATVLGLVLQRDPQQILYADLKPDDSKAVAKKLSELNIPYHLSEDGSTISVVNSQVYNARMQLAKEGLPGQDVVGFEKFDGSTIGMSSYIQRIQYVRAVQGELTRSIQRLNSVKTARVHISIPPKKTFLEDQEPAKASVVLELKPGMTPTKAEMKGVAHLVASAVEGLKINQITIVDTRGNFLHNPEEDSGAGVSTAMLEMQRSMETDHERRIVELLTPVVGLGKVKAKVTVEMDPSRVNLTEESYDPERAVARSTIKTDEVSNGSRPNPIGIPGSRSNLPGSEAQNATVPMASNNTEKNSTNTNYAIPKKIQVIDKPGGTVKRLTVAVVVDGYYSKSENANEPEKFTPRTEEELKRLQEIVGNAVGYDSQRRDSITVSSLPFRTTDLTPVEEPTPAFDWKEFSKHGLRNALIGLVFLLFFFMVLRPYLKWSTTGDIEKELELIPTVLPKTVAQLEGALKAEKEGEKMAAEKGLRALAEGKTEVPVKKTDREIEEDLKTKILEKLQTGQKKAVRIVQDWLEEEPEPKVAEG